jgi:hypothetical protein
MKYTIENYFGGEMKDETLHANTLEEAKSLQRGEFSLIINNTTNTVSE